jgi:Na+/melibiose symporter-like transporter
VFLINVPIVIIGIIGIMRVVPETRNPHPRRLDLQGLVISVVGLVLLVYGIIHASETRNWLDPGVIIPIVSGVAIIALFLFLEARSDHSSFDVSLFRNRGYAVSLGAVTLAFFAMSGITFSLPFYLQILRGYSTLVAGLCFLPFAVGQLLSAPRSAALVQRFGYRAVMTSGLSIVVVALIGLTQLRMDTPLWFALVAFFLFGLGMGMVVAPGSTVMQNVLPLARAGAGSAVQNTVRQVGGALGVAIIGTVLATQYAKNLAPAVATLPPSIPDAAKEAATESIVAADAVLDAATAQGAPAAVIDPLRAGAYDAFLSAAHVTNWISVAVVLVAAILVAVALPRITPPTERMERGESGAPQDPADALVTQEAAAYREELAGEIVPEDRRG